MTSSIHVAFLPVYQNPYQKMLGDALQTENVRVTYLKTRPPRGWLEENRDRIHVLHFHWINGLYTSGFLRYPYLRFRDFVQHARRLGYGMVWTIHNVVPHQTFPRWLHVRARRFMLNHVDALITHCEYGKNAFTEKFPHQLPFYVIPHGNYEHVISATITREAARQALGIAEEPFVYAVIGNISPYKGVDTFVKAFRHMAEENDLAIIAGRNRDRRLVWQLQKLAAQDARLRVLPGFVTDEDMTTYLRAADVAIYAFRGILTSGSVILALTHGTPVIVPAQGCMPELISPETGILYPSSDTSTLAHAMQQIKQADLSAMSAAAQSLADSLQWEHVARQTTEVYLNLRS